VTEFVIHIGPHKTGTTYLQVTFRALRKELAARGILYPEEWELTPGNPSHFHLVRQLREKRIDELQARMADLLAAKPEKILISSEDLSGFNPGGTIGRLRSLTEGHPVRIVFYSRRWSDLLPSAWQEGLKHGRIHTLPAFLLQHLQSPRHSRVCNPDAVLETYMDRFGRASVSIACYSDIIDRGIDLFEHFAANFLAWPDAERVPLKRRPNPSRDAKETELIRALNAHGQARGMPATSRLRWAYDRLKDPSLPAALYPAMDLHTKTLELDDNIAGLASLHKALVRNYSSHLVGPRPPGRLFEPKTATLTYISADYLSEPGAGGALRQMYKRIEERLAQPDAPKAFSRQGSAPT
jgi:hypothetical protein